MGFGDSAAYQTFFNPWTDAVGLFHVFCPEFRITCSFRNRRGLARARPGPSAAGHTRPAGDASQCARRVAVTWTATDVDESAVTVWTTVTGSSLVA